MALDFLKPKSLELVDELNKIESKGPVPMEQIEDMIKIINVAKETGCMFTLALKLEIGDFSVSSDNFKEIKLLKANKTEGERLMIAHSNALMIVHTMIEVKHIIGVNFTLKFSDKSVDNYGEE